ncbi:MAG: hypothetical protein L7U53_04835, partial [Candidatus Poseidoniaceae archaeon]|nr:hypothetical protein [Candidatus Poseidoniaceae archaeon]
MEGGCSRTLSSIETERVGLLKQRRKAYVLIFMMIMLAQTSYIGAMHGWSYPTKLDEDFPQERRVSLDNLFSDLDLRLFVDPTNSSSYSGSGTNVADLSGFNNNGTVAAAGPTWDSDFTRFTYDGACTGSSGNYACDEIEIEDSTTLRPGEPYEDLAVELNQGSTTNQHLKAPSTTEGYTLGAISTSFTISAWIKPTDCEGNSGTPTIVNKKHSYMIGCD